MTKQLIKTSVTDPLRINWLEFNNHWGRIGMTLCPGKKQQNAISGNWYRDLVSDVMTIAASGARHVISLIDIKEMAELQVLGLQSTVEGRGMKWHHFPIPDFGVPPKSGNSSIENIVTTIVNALNAEEDVVIHCKGGLGRTGTVVATFLSLYGMRAKQSLDIVRSARPGAVQTIGQAEFVHNNFRSDGPMVDIDVKISTLPIRSEITGSASLTKAEAVEGLLITLREQLTSGRFPEASKSAKAVLALDDKNEEAKAARQAAADARGSWNENPEEDGFWISPDRSQMEVFGVDLGRLGPENDHNFGSNVAESENDEQPPVSMTSNSIGHWWVNWPPNSADALYPDSDFDRMILKDSELESNRVPSWRDGWKKINAFALSFPADFIFEDGNWSDLGDLEIQFESTGWLPSSLPILRGALYFEQRKARNSEVEMQMPWTAVLLEAIRLVIDGIPPTAIAISDLGVPTTAEFGYPDKGVCGKCGKDLDNFEWKCCPYCSTVRAW